MKRDTQRYEDGAHILRSHVRTLLPAAEYNDVQVVPSSMSVMLISPGGQLIGRQDSLSNTALPSPERPAELLAHRNTKTLTKTQQNLFN